MSKSIEVRSVTMVTAWKDTRRGRIQVHSYGNSEHSQIEVTVGDGVPFRMTNAEFDVVSELFDVVIDRHEPADEEQRRSFAFGNVSMHNPNVTREVVDRAADALEDAANEGGDDE